MKQAKQTENTHNSNTNKKIDFNLQEKKNMHCVVDNNIYKCYQVPLSSLVRLQANQVRVKDCHANKVTELADDLVAVGQVYPICINSSGEIIFGHTRFRASGQVFDNGESIPNVKDGYIWARLFRGTRSEATVLGIRENSNKRPQSPATPEDVIYNIKKLIRMGYFDDANEDFQQFTDEKQKAIIQEFVTKQIPSWGGRKFKGFWNKLRTEIEEIRKKFTTWDKNKLCEYFLNNNPYGIKEIWEKERKSKDKIKEVFSSGEVFDTKNDGKICVWFLTASPETTGGTWKSSTHNKCASGEADKVVIVAAQNWSNDQKIENERRNILINMQKWNEILFDKNGNNTPSVHEVYFVPQRESEEKLINKGQYAKIHDFVKGK